MSRSLALLDGRLLGVADAAALRLGGGRALGAAPLRALLAAEAASLVLLAGAVASLGGWLPTLLAAVVVVARGPGLQRAWPRPGRGVAAALAARASAAAARRGALGLCAAYAGIALLAGAAGLATDALWPEAADAAAFGIDPEALVAWKLAALPASTATELARRYAESALPGRTPSLSGGRSRPGGAA